MIEIARIFFVFVLLVASGVSAASTPDSDDGNECSERLFPKFESEDEVGAFANRRFNGSTPFPMNLAVTMEHPETNKTMVVRILKISDQDKAVQKVVAMLKQASLDHSEMLFREVAGLFFSYQHRQNALKHFTSDLPGRVEQDVHLEAIEDEGILQTLEQQPDDVLGVIHFHTHPGFEYRRGTAKDYPDMSLLPNWTDFEAYEYMSSLFAYHAKQPVPFSAVVIPMCEHCDDVLFALDVAADQVVMDRIDFKKRMRELSDALAEMDRAEAAAKIEPAPPKPKVLD